MRSTSCSAIPGASQTATNNVLKCRADSAQASHLPVRVASLRAVLNKGLRASGRLFESPQKPADGVLQLDPLAFRVSRPCVLQPVGIKDAQVGLYCGIGDS